LAEFLLGMVTRSRPDSFVIERCAIELAELAGALRASGACADGAPLRRHPSLRHPRRRRRGHAQLHDLPLSAFGPQLAARSAAGTQFRRTVWGAGKLGRRPADLHAAAEIDDGTGRLGRLPEPIGDLGDPLKLSPQALIESLGTGQATHLIRHRGEQSKLVRGGWLADRRSAELDPQLLESRRQVLAG
jgi:hypothetical protein